MAIPSPNAVLCIDQTLGIRGPVMFIAMNRFKVIKGSEAAFENVWLSRDSRLEKVPGFVEFHLLEGLEADDHTLYGSHTVWESRACVRDMDQICGVSRRAQ
jgi:hypothetical protein